MTGTYQADYLTRADHVFQGGLVLLVDSISERAETNQVVFLWRYEA